MLHKIVSVLSLLSLLLVLSCSSTQRVQRPEVMENRERVVKLAGKPARKSSPAAKRTKGTEAVWHLISPSEIIFQLVREGDGSKEFIQVSTVLSSIRLSQGEWRVSGFIWQGKKYEAQIGFPEFNFYLKKDASNYIGSYLVECPRVSEKQLPVLRKMHFFNRYHFTSGEEHCEMVVGHDLENVARAWSKLVNSPALQLIPAF